jgi:hypothetical protein
MTAGDGSMQAECRTGGVFRAPEGGAPLHPSPLPPVEGRGEGCLPNAGDLQASALTLPSPEGEDSTSVSAGISMELGHWTFLLLYPQEFQYGLLDDPFQTKMIHCGKLGWL